MPTCWPTTRRRAGGQRGRFLAGCTQVGRPPKDEVLAVVASISDGEIPQWLFDTYSTDGTANTIDLDGLWSDVKALSGLGSEVAYGLHTVFGGYCSDKEAIAANRCQRPGLQESVGAGRLRDPLAPGSDGRGQRQWSDQRELDGTVLCHHADHRRIRRAVEGGRRAVRLVTAGA